MVKITVNEDCGNAPKMLYLKDFIIALIKNDKVFINQNMADDISWHIVGNKNIQGKENTIAVMGEMRSVDIKELIIHNMVTHGYTGAIDGLLKFKDGKEIAFCDIYTFNSPRNNAPVKEITSYIIKLRS